MEPIPVFFENVNRTALVIKPNKPYFDWLNSIENLPDDPDIYSDTDIYLLPDFDDLDQMQKWIKKNFDIIFCDQMNHWYTDESLWIQNRTFKLFTQWFDYSLHTMVWDTLDKPVSKF